MHLSYLSLHALQVYQPPAPVVGVAVGLAAGTVGVGVVPVVGSAVGLGVAGIGVVVAPVVGVGSTVGFVAGTFGVVDVPTVGVVPTLVVGLVVGVTELPLLAAAGVVVKVAAVTTPLPSMVNVAGFWIFSRPTQFRPPAPSVALRRFARKVKSELATAGIGEAAFCVNPVSCCRIGIPSFYQILAVDPRIG